MKFTSTGFDQLDYYLKQVGQKVTRGVLDEMRNEGDKIAQLARKFAPIDHGNLEEAIQVQDVGGGRDSLGRFARKAVEVFVNPDARGHNGEPIMQYAYLMNEGLAPFGSGRYHLGELSKIKQDGQKEIVGGRYLERAVDEVQKDMMNHLVDIVQQTL